MGARNWPGGHLDAVGLDQLDAVLDDALRQVVERIGLAERLAQRAPRQPQVDVRGGVVVDVEPDVLLPAELDQLLVLKLVLAHVWLRAAWGPLSECAPTGCSQR